MKSRGGNYHNSSVQLANPSYIDKQLKKASLGDTNTSLREFLCRKIPVHFGGISDPFSEYDRKYKITEKLLATLNKYQYPTIISTRSSSLTNKNLISALNEGKYIIQVSIPTNNQSNLKKMFSNELIYNQQLDMIQLLNEQEINVVCRIQPVFPKYEEEYIRMIDEISSRGVDYFVLEHFKLPFERKNINLVNEKLGYDILDFYRQKKAKAVGREWALPPEYKLLNITKMAKQVPSYENLHFGFADNDLMHLNKFNCCIGPYSKIEEFSRYYKYTITNAILKSREKLIKLNSIDDEWYPSKSINRVLNSKSRIKGKGISIKDYIAKTWNSDNHLSPKSYYGIIDTQDCDSDGNKIYSWDKRILRGH